MVFHDFWAAKGLEQQMQLGRAQPRLILLQDADDLFLATAEIDEAEVRRWMTV